MTVTTARHRHLTPNMRAALRAARSQPLRRVHDGRPGRPLWPAHPATLAALVRLELVRRGTLLSRKGYRCDTWQITDAGVAALEPPPPDLGDLPRTVYLAERPGGLCYRTLKPRPGKAFGRVAVDQRQATSGDYTRDPRRRMRGEPDVTVWLAA